MTDYGFGGAASTFGSGNPLAGSNVNLDAKKQQIMDQVKSELALANAQELVNKMGEKCFSKCLTKPGTRLDSSEQSCLAKCMDRYMEAWNIVSRSYIARAQREAGSNSANMM